MIYIIAGPNGVGKTTFANEFLTRYVRCNEFLNADLIAAGLSPYLPESQNVRASQLMLERMQDLVGKRKTFAFETTLAARSYRQKVLEWKEIGYRVHLFFLWLPNPDMAVLRVANRVKQGGHNIPEHTIRQRYARGIQNFQSLYRRNKRMIRNENDDMTITEKAQSAFLNVAVSVVERAKQTHTPIIVYDDERIQILPPGDFEKLALDSSNDPKTDKE